MNQRSVKMFHNVQPTPFQIIFNAAAQYNDIINLGVGEPDLDAPKEVTEAMIKAAEEGFTHYPPLPGFMDLRQEVCKYWDDNYGLSHTPDEVLVAAGCSQAMDMILRAYVGAGDEVLITDPCFPAYHSLVAYTGAVPIHVPVKPENEFVLSPEELESYITPKTKMLMLNSPCNPTGAVYDRSVMEAIAKIVLKHDLLVMSDEIYEALLFEGEHTCFATLPGMKERTFTMGGFSKTYAMTGLRLGYIMTTKELLAPLSVLSSNMAMSVSSIAQKGGLAALQHCQYYVDDMVRLYTERAACITELIEKTPGISCVKPKGTFYVMVDISQTGMKSLDFSMELLKEQSVATIPGIAFGQTADDFIRISFNGSPEMLTSAMDRVGKFMEKIG